ncbi:MAG: helix-turn-helix domain-containing protein [Thermoplasmata archaeon]|nr:helix-turn-helix domain-containing protein [Thermoplasmata archaeon]
MDRTSRLPRTDVHTWPEPSAAPRHTVSELPSPASLVQGLRLIGMPSREARLYLALVRGPLGVREAAETAGLHRATAYRVLLRLLDRGMVVGDGRSPQRFHAVAPDVLLHRLNGLFQEEAEIAALLAEVYGRWVVASLSTGPTVEAAGSERPRILSGEGRAPHPVLAEIGEARQSLDVLVRPLSMSLAHRTGLARTLGKLARQGVRVRVVTDATPADYRFATAMAREAGDRTNAVQVRHFTPVVGHFYAIDGRRVIRLPTLGVFGRAPQVAVIVEDLPRVRAQMARFEAFWTEGSGALRAPRSTRSYGWRSLNEPTTHRPTQFGVPANGSTERSGFTSTWQPDPDRFRRSIV